MKNQKVFCTLNLSSYKISVTEIFLIIFLLPLKDGPTALCLNFCEYFLSSKVFLIEWQSSPGPMFHGQMSTWICESNLGAKVQTCNQHLLLDFDVGCACCCSFRNRVNTKVIPRLKLKFGVLQQYHRQTQYPSPKSQNPNTPPPSMNIYLHFNIQGRMGILTITLTLCFLFNFPIIPYHMIFVS